MSVAVVLLAAVARAQDPPADDAALALREAQLRARLAAAATDQSARCELGFVLVRRGHAADATPELDRAIAALAAPADGGGRRLLAACEYNRGRAAEALGDVVRARAAYRRSLALRPAAAVAQRLRTLDPATAPGDALVGRAVALAAEHCVEQADLACTADPDALPTVAAPGACDDGSRWIVVPVIAARRHPSIGYVAFPARVLVAFHGDAFSVVLLSQGDPSGNEVALETTAAVTPLAPGRCGVVVDHGASWWQAAMGEGEDGYDAEDDSRDVLWWDGATLRSVEVPTARSGEHGTFTLTAMLDGRGAIVVRRTAGRVPPDVRVLLGRRSLDGLAGVP